MPVLWFVVPLVWYIFTDVSEVLQGDLMTELANTSETRLNLYDTTKSYNTEDIHIHK